MFPATSATVTEPWRLRTSGGIPRDGCSSGRSPSNTSAIDASGTRSFGGFSGESKYRSSREDSWKNLRFQFRTKWPWNQQSKASHRFHSQSAGWWENGKRACTNLLHEVALPNHRHCMERNVLSRVRPLVGCVSSARSPQPQKQEDGRRSLCEALRRICQANIMPRTDDRPYKICAW